MVITWAVLAIGLGVFAPRLEHALSGAMWEVNGSESPAARDVIDAQFGGLSSQSAVVVIQSESTSVDDPAFQQLIADVNALIDTEAGFGQPMPTQSGMDGRTVMIQAGANVDPTEAARVAQRLGDDIGDLSKEVACDQISVALTGSPALWDDFNAVNREGMLMAEILTWPITAVILVIAFGTLAAAGLALVLTAAGVMIAVFHTFAIAGTLPMKEMGLIFGTALLLDAFLIRLVLVPATLYIIGDRAWWLPRWMNRILPKVKFAHWTSAMTVSTGDRGKGDCGGLADVERVDVGADGDPDLTVGGGERHTRQASALGAEEHGETIGDVDAPEIVGGRHRRHRPHLETCRAHLGQHTRPLLGGCPCDRQCEHFTHAHPHRAATVGIGAGRIDQDAVDAECLGGPGDRSEVLVVVEAFEHGDPGRCVEELVEPHRGAAFGAGDHATMQIEADHVGDHASFGDEHRHAMGGERRLVVSEPLDPRWCQEHRPDCVARLDQPVDRHEALHDEHLLALVTASKCLIVERPVVVESGIGRIGNDVRHPTLTGRRPDCRRRTP